MNKRRRIFIGLVLSLIIAVGISGVYGATASEINNSIKIKQQQLNKGKAQEAGVQKDINSIQSKIDSTQKEIDSMVGKVTDTRLKVEEATARLEAKKKELQESVDGLNKRLRNMYKGGSIGFIDVILSSSNGSELIYNIDMVKRIYKGDKQLVEILTVEHAKIAKEQKELTDLQAALESQQAELSKKEAELNANQSELTAQKDKLAGNNAALVNDIEDLRAQSAAIEREIKNNPPVVNPGGGGGSGAMTWPVPSSRNITSPFGNRWHPIFHKPLFHSGIDIAAPYGSTIVAARGGTVYKTGYMGGYGNTVMIAHSGNIQTLYAHNSSILVSTGQNVSAGQPIALMGSTGNSTGSHLHFEVRVGGTPVDPMGYL